MFRIKLRVIVAIALCHVTTISAEQPGHPLVTQHERQSADRPILSVETLEGIDWSKVACTTMMDRAQLAGLALECHRTGKNLKNDIRRRYAICEWLPECLDFLNLIKCPVSAREAITQYEMVRPLDLYYHIEIRKTFWELSQLEQDMQVMRNSVAARAPNERDITAIQQELANHSKNIRVLNITMSRSFALGDVFRKLMAKAELNIEGE